MYNKDAAIIRGYIITYLVYEKTERVAHAKLLDKVQNFKCRIYIFNQTKDSSYF